jgi:hypothetical protein
MMSHWAQFKDCTQKRQDFVAARQQAAVLLTVSAKSPVRWLGSVGYRRLGPKIGGAFRRRHGQAEKPSSLFLETLY